MNPIASFDFGRTITTLLPGLAILVGLSVALESASIAFGLGFSVAAWAFENPAVSAVTAIPLGLTLGLFSNTVYFVYLNSRLIEQPLKRRYEKHFVVEEKFKRKVVDSRLARLPGEANVAGLEEAVDPGSLLMSHMDVESRVISRESFWFYYKFQLNMAVAVVVIVPSLLWLSFLTRANWGVSFIKWIFGAAIVLAATVALVRLLVSAARDNYYYHRRLQLSLRVEAFLQAEAPARD